MSQWWQVCGNKELVKCLSEWLQNWQIRRTSLVGRSEGDMFHRTVANSEDCDEDKGWSEEDSDGVDNTNVLVLVGPVGVRFALCGLNFEIFEGCEPWEEGLLSWKGPH